MTETTTSAHLSPAAPGKDLPPNLLLDLIVAILAPMFLGATAGDIYFARLAAIETVNAYHARNNVDLIAIAQIIACGLAALGSLSLSMADEISIEMALRLRGNANALNRTAEQNRRTLREAPAPATTPKDQVAEACRAQYEAEALASLAAAQELIAADQAHALQPVPTPPQPIKPDDTVAPSVTDEPTMTERQRDTMWAAALARVAQEFTASLPDLPPAEREMVSLRVAALSSTASELIAGRPVPPVPLPPG